MCYNIYSKGVDIMTAKKAKRISDREYKKLPKEVINLILRMVSIYAHDGDTSYTFNGKIRNIKLDFPQAAAVSRLLAEKGFKVTTDAIGDKRSREELGNDRIYWTITVEWGE